MRRWLIPVATLGLVASGLASFMVLGGPRPDTAGEIILAAATMASLVAVALLLRWLFRWRDPRWDSPENQARAQLWSTRSGSGGDS
jgi:hypothetical protein